MCCEPQHSTDPTVGECPECGTPVDADGYATEGVCGYSPILCEKCGYAPCDLSC